jgi:hypothetical protein
MNSKILQINTNRNSATTEHVLQVAIKLNISILAVQEPWVIQTSTSYRSVNYTSFTQVFPNFDSTIRPRAIFYILKSYKISLALNSPKDPDYVIINLIDLNTQLVNIYNATYPNIPNSIPFIQRGLLPASLAANTIIVGDFNTHYPWWDPLRP